VIGHIIHPIQYETVESTFPQGWKDISLVSDSGKDEDDNAQRDEKIDNDRCPDDRIEIVMRYPGHGTQFPQVKAAHNPAKPEVIDQEKERNEAKVYFQSMEHH